MGNCCSGIPSDQRPNDITLAKKPEEEQDDYKNTVTRINDYNRGLVVRNYLPDDE